LLSCVGFCEPMLSIIKGKIEFSSEFSYFKRLVNHKISEAARGRGNISFSTDPTKTVNNVSIFLFDGSCL
jgi:hypothetical protein